jgi:hypothetical protein
MDVVARKLRPWKREIASARGRISWRELHVPFGEFLGSRKGVNTTKKTTHPQTSSPSAEYTPKLCPNDDTTFLIS